MIRPEPELRPLREDPDLAAPELRLGARLLGSSGPLPRSELRKRRVWQALARGSGSRMGARVRTLRLAFTGVLFAAASSAAVGHYYVKQAERATSDAAAPSLPRATSPRPRSPTPAKLDAPARNPEVAATAPALSSKATPLAPPRPRSDAARSPKLAAAEEADAQLLVEAMRARRAGDAARVGKLVDEYRAKHPQGALQEEALILALESAVARRAPNSASLAREYLSRYPHGRFVAQARRAMSLEPQ